MRMLPMPDCRCGAAAIKQIPEALRELGAKRVLVVTDQGIVKAGILDRLLAAVEGGAAIEVFDGAQPDPSVSAMRSLAALAEGWGVDAVIGLGGGSSLDTAKIAAALVANRRDIAEYLKGAPLTESVLPILAVPTTAGTGSEATPIAVISDEEAQVKIGVVSPRIMQRVAFLDPELCLGLPPAITAITGMDALCHAIESYTSVNATEFSEVLSLRAVELIDGNLLEAFRNGANARVREKMLLGSLMAGVAFANAGVTAVHAFAYPLGGKFHVAHGLANSLMLATILRFNFDSCAGRLARIGAVMREGGTAETVVQRVDELSRELRLPRNLAAVGITEESIEPMSRAVVLIERLLKNNPRKVSLEDAKALYLEAFRR
jgi:alcohol dehydrogenase class IV